jgi:DNA (cytosine-5)-methyltransferase 1
MNAQPKSSSRSSKTAALRLRLRNTVSKSSKDFNQHAVIARALTIQTQNELHSSSPLDSSAYLSEAPYQVLDFFCGCGGMSSGFAALGNLFPSFEVIGGCDINPDAGASFEANHKAPCLIRDITRLKTDPRSIASLLSEYPRYDSNRPLVLIGCAPCQGFTSHRKKNWAAEDNRNKLVGAFANLATSLKPACIVMENVPEFLSHKYWKFYESFKKQLEDAGYVVKASIYNTAAFGVPQERFRALVLAMRKDFVLPHDLLERENFVTVRQAIGELPAVSPGKAHPGDVLHRCARHLESTLSTIKAVPKNGGSRPAGVGPKCLDKVKGYYDVYGRLFWDRPAITITQYARNPASGRYTHPEQNRGLTIREAALLQSFPPEYSFLGGFDAIFKQVGEAVPPKFSCAIAAHVLTELSLGETGVKRDFQYRTVTKPVNNSYSSVIAGIKTKKK